MAIRSIGTVPNFTAKVKTEKGNEYETCNTGKIVGGTVGAAFGSYNIWSTNKKINIALDQVKDFSEQIGNQIQEELSQTDKQELNKAFTKGKKIGKGVAFTIAGISALILTGIGLLAGKIYDNKQNEKREKAADIAAEENKKTQQPQKESKTEQTR